MSDDEDDYLSDKFLFAAEAPPARNKPSTYSDLRRQAAKEAQDRSLANRVKSARELRDEALSKTLFERAQEEEEARRKAEAADAGAGAGASSSAGGNKALAMMMKMGFKPGMALGKGEEEDEEAKPEESASAHGSISRSPEPSKPKKGLVEPIAVKEWKGAHTCISAASSYPLANLRR